MLPVPFSSDAAAAAPSSDGDRMHVLRVAQTMRLTLEARLSGARMSLREILDLQARELLSFGYGLEQPVELVVNRQPAMRGRIVGSGTKRSFTVDSFPDEE